MTNDILSQVRALKESGELQRMAGSGVAGLLARFALMVLEQKMIVEIIADPLGTTITKCKLPSYGKYELFTLPPVPAPDDVEVRGERAAKGIKELFANYHSEDVEPSWVKEIITAAIKGE